ncbi:MULTISPECIES: TonB-dependent siderophore receptor [Agrobacterium]|uniref:TonB-dependent siderophore receptor n=1 Tax=Agrobacterium TaxID=357 RepID=UPI002448D6F0|nr:MULTISPECIES: TonB-dependent siderophore receptor [Agrobacterium]MDH0871989.1 TonB-dependent siderophore receptor [Agrobacterium pusense]
MTRDFGVQGKTKHISILAGGCAAIAYVAFLAPASALAQDAGTTVLQTITVDGAKNQDPKAPVKGYVAKTSASATKTGRSLIETPQSVSVITRDQMDAQDVRNLGEALNYVPGVVAQPFGADPRFDAPRIRGFQGNQLQFLNGLRLMRTAGAPSFEVYGLERVEVIRGPASVLYGQGNPSGLINLSSKRPTFERFGEVGAQIGSFDYYQSMFDIGGPVADSDSFAYRLTGLARNAHAQTDNLQNDRYFIAPALTWQPDEDTKLTVLASYQHDNPSSPSGLPPALTYFRPGNMLDRSFYVGDPSFDTSNRKFTNIGYEFEHRFDETFTFRQNARYSNFDWSYRALGMSSTSGGMIGNLIRRNATFQDELLNTFNIDNSLQADFSTGPIDHTLLVGLDYRYFDNNVKTEFWAATPLNPVNPVYGGPISLTARTLYADVKTDISQIGLYAQDEMAIENWRITAGLRQDWASTSGTTFNGTTYRTLDKDDHKLTGRVGVSYLFDGGIAPYVSYATSFEPVPQPAVGDAPKPTTGEQWEAGVKYQPEGFDGFFSAAIYDLKQKNVTTTVGGVTQQMDEAHVKGLELEGVASLVDGLDLRAAYTYMDSEVSGRVNNGNELDSTPRHAASLWLDYTFPEDTALEGFGIGGGVRYVGKRYGDAANTFEMKGLALLDLGVHYEKNGYRASLMVQNLTDKEYISSCSTFGCYYGDGRTVMGKLTYRW